MITKQKLKAYDVSELNEPKKVIFPWFASLLFYGLAIYVFLIAINILISSFFGFNLTMNYISDLGSKKVIPFPYFHDLTCVFGGLISLPTNYFVRKKLRIQYKHSKHSLLFLEIGVASGIVGNVSYVLLGVFSLDRAGPGQIYHGIIAFLSFGGFIISIFFFSLNIVLSHKCKLKNLGKLGLVVPILLFILYCAITIPLIEWFLLTSIALFMLFLDYYIFKV
ncbi:MAG: hypothetical protein HWN79_03010 [Candidatus Lokiarchaeota archaeon]|nr:hypothetical protein [Candidatus Lokiarchaeota archaeon]